MRHRGTVFAMTDGAGGAVRQLAPFAKLAGCDPSAYTPAPALDEHGEAIRAELQRMCQSQI